MYVGELYIVFVELLDFICTHPPTHSLLEHTHTHTHTHTQTCMYCYVVSTYESINRLVVLFAELKIFNVS